jgi:hypothetical protein
MRAGLNNDFARKINNLCRIVTNYFQKKRSIPPNRFQKISNQHFAAAINAVCSA